MSGIVDTTGRPVRKPKRRGSDYATLDELLNVVGNATGPLAVVLQEVMQKLARVEDKLGITDETEAAEPAPARGTPYRSMAEPEPDIPHDTTGAGGDSD